MANKVILLAPTPPPAGGIAGWTVRMMSAFPRNGWQIVLVDEKVSGERQVFGDGAKRNLFSEVKRCFRIWRDLIQALKDPAVKVVHSCIPSLTLSMLREYVCACITKMHKKKFIIHFRCTVPETTKGRLGNFLLKHLCNKSDLIITLNSQTNAYLETLTKTPFKLIPNFVSESEVSSSRLIREEIKTVLYVGGVVESKGAFDVLNMARRFPEIEFRLAGKTASEVEQYAKENRIHNAVFTGQLERSEVKKELELADAFVFLTYFRGEGFSNALAEAMASGLPCIVTDWAANHDMIGDDGGFVVPVKDVSSACEALLAMMPQEVRKAQSEANLRKIRAQYLESVVIDQYVDCYERFC